jgi:hypothetical protein
MSGINDRPYVEDGNPNSDQAEHSSANPAAGNTQMRILIELEVISNILFEAFPASASLGEMRKDIAKTIT